MIQECEIIEIQTSITYIFPNFYIFLKQTLHWSQQISLCIGIIHWNPLITLHVPTFSAKFQQSLQHFWGQMLSTIQWHGHSSPPPVSQVSLWIRDSEVSRGFSQLGHPPILPAETGGCCFFWVRNPEIHDFFLSNYHFKANVQGKYPPSSCWELENGTFLALFPLKDPKGRTTFPLSLIMEGRRQSKLTRGFQSSIPGGLGPDGLEWSLSTKSTPPIPRHSNILPGVSVHVFSTI